MIAKSRRAFTLIELLIVVAIIAILAAIAVPNFLEAQTRSKISRVKSDMRTIATGIEAYAVDYNRPPVGTVEMIPACISQNYASFDYNAKNPIAESKLTTPVAYIASLPRDPFHWGKDTLPADQMVYVYHAYVCKSLTGWFAKCARAGYTWALMSRGPSMVNPGGLGIQNIIL